MIYTEDDIKKDLLKNILLSRRKRAPIGRSG